MKYQLNAGHMMRYRLCQLNAGQWTWRMAALSFNTLLHLADDFHIYLPTESHKLAEI